MFVGQLLRWGKFHSDELVLTDTRLSLREAEGLCCAAALPLALIDLCTLAQDRTRISKDRHSARELLGHVKCTTHKAEHRLCKTPICARPSRAADVQARKKRLAPIHSNAARVTRKTR